MIDIRKKIRQEKIKEEKKKLKECADTSPLCDTCKHMHYSNKYLDYNKRPIMIECKFQKYKRLIGSKSCKYYEK